MSGASSNTPPSPTRPRSSCISRWSGRCSWSRARAGQHMARLIEQMSHDDRVDLLRRLPPRVVESLLRLVDEADRRDIATLVKYPENTAGALMTTDYAWLPANITAERGAGTAAPAGARQRDDLLHLRPRRSAASAGRGVAARADPGAAAGLINDLMDTQPSDRARHRRPREGRPGDGPLRLAGHARGRRRGPAGRHRHPRRRD